MPHSVPAWHEFEQVVDGYPVKVLDHKVIVTA